MICAHFGVAVFLAGVLIVEATSIEKDVRLAPNQTVSIGFSGSYTDTGANCFGTGFVGKRSVAFESTMRFLAPSE